MQRLTLAAVGKIQHGSKRSASPLCRLFHGSLKRSGAGKATSSPDNRLAGRLRFYKVVGVEAVSPPWEESSTPSVESPISAGVDGTDSASGVQRPNDLDVKSLQEILIPRVPGSTEKSQSNGENWFGIVLDGRSIKTPMGKKLAVPSETLAYAIAEEWDAQAKYLQPANMPFMTLACTALDQAAYHPDFYRNEAMRFLPTDTTCYWADPTEDRVLHRRQEQAWKGLHSFAKEKFNGAPAFALGANEGMLMSRIRGDAKPTAGLPHPTELMEGAQNWTRSLDAWNLVALSSICSQAKSFLVAWAVLERDSPLANDLTKAVDASRVEEEFQISNWGLVEGGHDYDRLNSSIQIRSAQLFARTIALDNDLF